MAEIFYRSTRSEGEEYSPSKALLKGLAPDGGLFVPTVMPTFADIAANMTAEGLTDDAGESTAKTLENLTKLGYKDVAYQVLRVFLTDYTAEEIRDCVEKAYDSKFDTPEIAPVVSKDGKYYLELFHGATIAFKDMALSILPHLMTKAARKNGVSDEIVILTATSGDTGKAALAGFADVPGTKIVVFYPKHGVSPVQEKQMVTQRGENVKVVGIEGNFDDAQNGVKAMFSDRMLEALLADKGYRFSSANSINIGRLVPQIAYYIWAYLRLAASGAIRIGDEINVTVPTGNFGNILAGYYAKRMGLPIGTLVCASNENKVLYDFFGSGTYDKNREFRLTSSPSMDILISSNLERLIFEAVGGSAVRCAELMSALKNGGKYVLTPDEMSRFSCFASGWTDEEGTAREIERVYKNSGYIIDTHTAVASAVAREYTAGEGAGVPMLVVSTASPYKFTRSVLTAIDEKYADMDDFALADELSALSGVPVPPAIESLRTAPVLHDTVCGVSNMRDAVLEFLK